MRLSDFDYSLDKKFIAQNPVTPRDSSKLLVFDTKKNKIYHLKFSDIENLLTKDDVLVVNRSKVVPARILFTHNGKKCEIFVLKKLKDKKYQVLVNPGKIFKIGAVVKIFPKISATVLEILEDGSRVIKFGPKDVNLHVIGVTPLPPYIKHSSAKANRYQTVYSKEEGSVAAPTAGLHFTKKLIRRLKDKGVSMETVLLHVGRGTFLPVKTEKLEDHVMHEEFFRFSKSTADRLNMAKKYHKRIIAVGTTSVRVLESCSDKTKGFVPKVDETRLFIYPKAYKWKSVDALITNFHLPKSTLLMLVSSFLEHKGVKDSTKKLLSLYELAKKNNYRFFSFGDAMFIF